MYANFNLRIGVKERYVWNNVYADFTFYRSSPHESPLKREQFVYNYLNWTYLNILKYYLTPNNNNHTCA